MSVVIAYSDAHRGITANYNKLELLCEYIEMFKPDVVVGVGDNYELVWRDWQQINSWKDSVDSIERAKEAARKTSWIELAGNHNINLYDYRQELLPIRVHKGDKIVIDGVTYTHGHQYDATIKFWWKPLQTIFKYVIPSLYNKIFGTPYCVKESGNDTNYSELVAMIESRVQTAYRGSPVVFGHTHSEFIKYRKSTFMANCGDFIDSCSIVVVSYGKPELIWI